MIGATIKKDVQLLLRDKGALASMFALPLAFISVFGLIFNNQGDDDEARGAAGAARKFPLALWAPPGNERAARIAADLESGRSFDIRRVETAEAADAMVGSKDAAGALLVPPDIDPEKGRPATLIVDEASSDAERFAVEGPVRASVIQSHYRHKYGKFLAMAGGGDLDGKDVIGVRSPAGVRKKREYADGFQITVPSNAVLFIFFLCIAVGLSFCEERKSGTWRRLLAAPVSRRTVLLAKLVPFFIIGILQMVFLFAVGILVFGMDVSGSFGALALVTISLVFCATALGFLISSFGGSEKQIGGITSIVVLIMGMVSGCMLPRFLLPEAMRQASLLVPHGWALDAYRDILVREGTTMGDMLLPAAVLFGFGVVYSFAGALIFRFER